MQPPYNPPSLFPPALARVATQLETFHGDGNDDGGGTLDFSGDFGFLKLPKGQSRSRHLQGESRGAGRGSMEGEGCEESRAARGQLKSDHLRLESSAQVASDAV